jgi:dipeptidyl aminopeptidase/acylaminoacyl peptidase
MRSRYSYSAGAFYVGIALAYAAEKRLLEPAELMKLRSVGQVSVSPDSKRIAYTVTYNDGVHPYSRVWVLNVSDGRSAPMGGDEDTGSSLEWSPDGRWLAYLGKNGDKAGLLVVRPDGSGPRFVAATSSTNNRLPETGREMAWSPDSGRIAYVSAAHGAEPDPAAGDPIVITRWLYRPAASDGIHRFADNRWLHVFIADLASGATRQLTLGTYQDHSIDWSPHGDEILFVSNRDADRERYFNYDLFTVDAGSGAIRRLTATEGCEYRPRWSPDGRQIAFQATRRGITYLDAFMEDMHVWTMDAAGGNPRELGAGIDNRQGEPRWDADGRFLYFTVQERGSTKLYRLPAAGRTAEAMAGDAGVVGSWSLGRDGSLAYSFSGTTDLAELYWKPPSAPAKQMTSLNSELLPGKALGETEAFTFLSHDHRFEVEAFLTKPAQLDPSRSYPLIVSIHGGPHGQQGPAFQLKNQIYASRGWATLMVNYRGSTGYGQRFADGIFGDQHGSEAQDVLTAVNVAQRRYLWLDHERMALDGVSYGGAICTWLITQTGMFKAAVANAPITNPITYNYLTNNNQYVHMAYGLPAHDEDLLDRLWEHAPLRFAARVRTPTMLIHGENDSDVPIVETEQFYGALKDVGVETVMVRYPREGHGIRETRHVIDLTARSIDWFEKYFAAPGKRTSQSTPAN